MATSQQAQAAIRREKIRQVIPLRESYSDSGDAISKAGKRRVLFLSGGGARGAYQVGAIEYLVKRGIRFDAIFGISTGSLQGAMLAQAKVNELVALWFGSEGLPEPIRFLVSGGYKPMRKRDIFSGWRLARMLTFREGMYSFKGLRRLLKRHVFSDHFIIPFFAGAVNIDRGLYDVFRFDDPDILKGIEASASIPATTPPVRIRGDRWADGGVRHFFGDLEAVGFDEMILVSTDVIGGEMKPMPKRVSWFSVALRAVSMLLKGLQSADLDDLDEFSRKGNMKVYTIAPVKPLHSSMSFDKYHLSISRDTGHIDASRVLGSIDFD